jgi:hypothetical protein
MTVDAFLQYVQAAYSFLDRFHMSPRLLLGIAAILLLTAFLAVREAVTWFLKIETLKKDIRRLHSISARLDEELRAVRAFMEKQNPAASSPLTSVSRRPSVAAGDEPTTGSLEI